MAEVVSLQELRKQREEASSGDSEKHIAGRAICGGCRYEWEAAAPVGATQLECPACASMRGVWKWPFSPAQGLVYQCLSCGSDSMIVHRARPEAPPEFMCAGCGKDHPSDEVLG